MPDASFGIFCVLPSDPIDRIVDFAVGAGGDVTNLSGLGFSNFTQVQAALSQSGSDVMLLSGGSDQILYANTPLANFNSTNFTYL